MITNLEEGGKIKCQRYWPESGRCSFGPFEISLTEEQILADYTIRKLGVQVLYITVCRYRRHILCASESAQERVIQWNL